MLAVVAQGEGAMPCGSPEIHFGSIRQNGLTDLFVA
jgi:hypothetical protein